MNNSLIEKYKTVYQHVISMLDSQLPKHLSYHCTDHTRYVLKKASYIAEKEGVSGEDLILLKIAALYHDSGFIENALEHETTSCRMAEEDLKTLGFSIEQIDKVKVMIMATRIPQNPANHLAQILADADLEYMGTSSYFQISELLYQELLHTNPGLTRARWLDIQISFLKSHHYHTRFCMRYKEHRKQKILKQLLIQKTH